MIKRNKSCQEIPAQRITTNEEVISISSTEEKHKVDKEEEIALASGSKEESTKDMEIESEEENHETEEDNEEDEEEDAEDDYGKESKQEVEEEAEMVITQSRPKKSAPQKRSGIVDFGADDSDDEDKEGKDDEEGDALVQEHEHGTNKTQREEHKKRLYAAWNKVSERALVKVKGKWYNIYDTNLLSPLPSPTKKFMKDFNQTKNEKIKLAKTTKKTGRLGLALNLYGSPGGKGFVNAKENKEEVNSNHILAPITPEKPPNKWNQSKEQANKPQEPLQTTKKTTTKTFI